MKFFNILALIIWVVNLCIGINHIANCEPINPIVHICACICCIVYYIGEVL
jgi:hypothetical protein